jgi:hypothetical protein
VNAHVVSRGVNPVDGYQLDQVRMWSVFDRQASGPVLNFAREQLASTFETRNRCNRGFLSTLQSNRKQPVLGAKHRLMNSFRLEWLQ